MRILLLTLALMLTAPLARAEEGAIQTVIQSQITAFEQDDFATAFTFASPSIKSLFGSPERFGAMVRTGYPMVWRPAAVDFLPLKEEAGNMLQDVMITDQAGSIHVLRYQMISTEAGWQINAVQLLRAPQVGA